MDSALSVFGFSKKTAKVFTAIQAGFNTPVKIAKETSISRPAIYAILKQLRARGLINSHIVKGLKYWTLATPKELDEVLYEAKRALVNTKDGTAELYLQSEVGITIYRGKESIQNLLMDLFSERRGERFRGIQGDAVYPAWRELFGLESIAEMNKQIKKNKLIVEAILPEGFFDRAFAHMGKGWAEDFEGRTYRANLLEREYFNHGSELFMFDDAVYLISMNEALVLEIRHSEIQKMLGLLLDFVQDNSRSVDGNQVLRDLVSLKQGAH